jgi:hypothetical protein
VNLIQSAFSTVRLRTKVTKVAGTRRWGLVTAYKAPRRRNQVRDPDVVTPDHEDVRLVSHSMPLSITYDRSAGRRRAHAMVSREVELR